MKNKLEVIQKPSPPAPLPEGEGSRDRVSNNFARFPSPLSDRGEGLGVRVWSYKNEI